MMSPWHAAQDEMRDMQDSDSEPVQSRVYQWLAPSAYSGRCATERQYFVGKAQSGSPARVRAVRSTCLARNQRAADTAAHPWALFAAVEADGFQTARRRRYNAAVNTQ